MLCLTLTGSSLDEDAHILERNRNYISMAELRLDALDASELPAAKDFPRRAGLPLILTFRRKADGGLRSVPEKKRIAFLADAAQGGYAYVDLEGDLRKADLRYEKEGARHDLEADLKARGVKIIRSFHDFKSVPDNIYDLIVKLSKGGAIPKVAVTPHSVADVITLFRVKKEIPLIKDMIVVGMGDWGVCTRILYKRIGSMLSYCCDSSSGIGQIDAKTMKTLYHADEVDERTHIYGVIGNPVLHSSSPQIHNPAFRAIHYNAIYVPFLVDDVRPFLRLAEMIQIHGFSVTIPHKRAIIPYIGHLPREVMKIGACNTVVHTARMWRGTNTDYYAFLSLVRSDIESGRIKSALVIGAGGAARAVVFALRNNLIPVTIVNRTAEHAQYLARETLSSWDTLENTPKYAGKVDLVVNTTSVGMVPDEDGDASMGFPFTGKEVAFDFVYKPRETVFLKKAEAAGCRCIHGADQLLEQGKLQFEEFSGYHYPPQIHPEIGG